MVGWVAEVGVTNNLEPNKTALGNEESQGLYFSRICYKCGERGHRANKCHAKSEGGGRKKCML